MMRDIESRSDIEKILEQFYEQAFKDELIGHFFTEVVPLNLETHLPVITDFWESVIFQSQAYRKNVMEIHQVIHSIEKIEKKHLQRWVEMMMQTIDNNFSGNNANLMKQRAASVATLMDIKLNHGQINKL